MQLRSGNKSTALLSDPQRLRLFNVVSPIAFLGGPGLAVAANLYAVLRLDVGREDGAVVSTMRLQIKLLNIVVILVGSALLITLVDTPSSKTSPTATSLASPDAILSC